MMTTTKKSIVGRTPSAWLLVCLATLALALIPWSSLHAGVPAEDDADAFSDSSLDLVELLESRGLQEMLAKDPIILVVSKRSALRNVSKTQLRNLYLRNTRTVGGKSSEPVNLPAKNKVRRAFDAKILGLSSGDASRHWVDQKLRGRSAPPVERNSELNVQLTSYRMRTAVGYIRLSALKPGKLRVLTIDGKSHDDPEYALR